MDFQSAVPAFLLLGSSVVTIVMRLRPDQGLDQDQAARNRWVVGFSLAIIAAVSTYIISQTGSPGAIVTEDQYMLAMLITTVFLLIYYVCTGSSPSDDDRFGAPTNGLDLPPPMITARCCGGDIRNEMVNTQCPPYIPPPDPYPPCIDNVYNETCYSKPFIPEGAVPCANTDERRMKIRWDRRIDCPKHRQMVLKGDYPWQPGTPNWQNRHYVDDNAMLWYGRDQGYAPKRDKNRNIQGKIIPRDATWGAGKKLPALGSDVGAGAVGPVPFMGSGGIGQGRMRQNEGASPVNLKQKPDQQQNFLWGQPPPREPRFRPPNISYVPQPYLKPEGAECDPNVDENCPDPDAMFAYPDSPVPGGAQFFARPQDDTFNDDNQINNTTNFESGLEPQGEPKDIVATNWRIIMSCALVLIFHRCYRNVVSLAKVQGYGMRKSVDPFQMISENASVLADAIKQDATMMVLLMSVACMITFVSMSNRKSGSNNIEDSRREEFMYQRRPGYSAFAQS